ncbi:MAG: DUF5615 family PIN-like protein [Actinomycetota bacterium]|nr:DUF5615 family PIN-like protein [Actinomycetota bacterium]
MKFLVDAQLPRRLARELNGWGHDAIHTLDLPDRNTTKDSEINRVADGEARVVITKDSDFRESHLLRGTPRRLLRVTTGNIANAELIALFERNLDAIEDALTRADHVELSARELIIHDRRAD